jgi:predicted AAA+ superfamily ATPase
VDGKRFDVSANLAQALRCLRLEDSPRVIWIDAICIDKSDDAEKSAQVARMGDICRNAADVLIFLGSEEHDSDLVMEYLGLEDEESVAPTVDLLEDREDYGRAQKHILERVQRCGRDLAGFIGAADAFFKRPWW